MGITLTNLPGFVESPARQISSSTGKLDRMTCILIGPATQAFANLPGRGSSHPEYPLMFCTDSVVSDREGAIASITANYSGRINTGGQNNFVSEKLTDFSSSEKELSYQRRYQIGYPITLSTAQSPGGSYQWHVGSDTYVHRYITKDVTYKYVVSQKPNGPKFNGNETSISSEYDRWTGRGSGEWLNGNVFGPATTPTQGPMGFVGPIMRCTQFQATQIISNWYECSETWEIRYEIGG